MIVPWAHRFEYLVPKWWSHLWRIRRRGLAGGHVSLGARL